jgi:hypothetical protein
MDRRIHAITVGCLCAVLASWHELGHDASYGLTFREWVLGILAGVAIGGGTGFLGFYAGRWIDRHLFDDDSDEV